MKDFFASRPTIWQFFWSIIKPYRWWYLLLFQAPVLTAFYVFANNYSLKLLIDAFSRAEIVSYAQLAYPISLFITAQILRDLVWRLSGIAKWKVEPFARRRLLLIVYDYIQHHSYRYFQNTQSGTIISRLRGILDGFESVFSSLEQSIVKSFSVIIISIFVLLLVNTIVFLFILIWCAAVIIILYPKAQKLNRFALEAAESKHHIIGLFADNISNIFSLFYFAKRKVELKQARKFMSRDYVPRLKRLYHYDFKFKLIGTTLHWFMLISVFVFMIYLRQNALISTGDFIFVMLTSLAIAAELWSFITGMCTFMRRVGDLKSSFSILEVPHEIIDTAAAQDYQINKGSIEFKDLSFNYHNHTVFSEFNLSIRAGEKIGLVGHSGAGKSTLIALLLKNFKPASGTILLDGKPVELISSDSLRKQISLIPQNIMLFHRSIADNIGYAKENASLEEIKRAAKIANIDKYIESLPEQYNTIVGERGVKLSGGQRQRIVIARAILKNAPIMILDEATSSLDTVTEQQIQQSIDTILETNRSTVIAIAHRLSTIRHMDRIIVMGEGKVLEAGSFTELVNKENGFFKALWDAQVNGRVL